MNISQGIKEYKITHYSNAYNFDNFSTEVSSVHFFNNDGLEVFYIIPTMYTLTFNVTIVNRVNPIDSKNKQDINGSHYAPFYLVQLPFKGYCESQMVTATHKNNLFSDCTMRSLSEMIKTSEFEDWRICTGEQLDQLFNSYNETLKTEASAITADRFDDMLNILPPSRWHSVWGFEVFHISERLTANIVSWYAKNGDQCFTFDQDATISDKEIKTLLEKAVN